MKKLSDVKKLSRKHKAALMAGKKRWEAKQRLAKANGGTAHTLSDKVRAIVREEIKAALGDLA